MKKLLKGVDLKCLQIVDVQHPDELVHLAVDLQRLVDAENNPGGQIGVNALDQSVSGLERLRSVHRTPASQP